MKCKSGKKEMTSRTKNAIMLCKVYCGDLWDFSPRDSRQMSANSRFVVCGNKQLTEGVGRILWHRHQVKVHQKAEQIRVQQKIQENERQVQARERM